ncbi:transketolase C-terminal domain-containing protein [Streptomyces sp. SPB162]|uniref:transketolase family protein n=1 Tax=Streptomyces sp. SPB162 TaxID=2940560 RepID=UPI002404AE66|nr:transketolase C-terminal domain-containing protein [Streptomyces sp. SPB162]MDF9815305.1 transketolase [Streptomyces sp. SPB162]
MTAAEERLVTAGASWAALYTGAAREACRHTLLELARTDPRIFCVDSDMGGFEDGFAAELPSQYVNVGIAEANLFGVSAGLAAAGLVPFAHTMSAFATTRACEQLKLDVAGSALPVRVVATHGGLSAGHYGPSHHAVQDLAILRTMPLLTVLVPADAGEAALAMRAAAYHPGPVYVRLGRKATPRIYREPYDFTIGASVRLADGDDVTVVATGPLPVHYALAARDVLAAGGFSVRVVNMHTIKPLDRSALVSAARDTAGIVTVEDHLVVGGLGGAVSEVVTSEQPCRVRRVGIEDRYLDSVGDERELLEESGVTVDRIVREARVLLGAAPAGSRT